MLECYSLLAALAARTEKIELSSLVTGNTYRNPTVLAKTITTLDVISKGRAVLGIGAGWFQLEHDALGFEFGTFTDRFEKLEEALQIIIPMINGEKTSFEGKNVICVPVSFDLPFTFSDDFAFPLLNSIKYLYQRQTTKTLL